jgi:26S proteasome regulatory subunit N9
MHPILEALKGTPHEWLRNLLFAYNAGDLAKFETLSVHFAQLVIKGELIFYK